MTFRLRPRDGWEHFGCATCGRVFMLPDREDDATPWCTHGSNYAWKPPVGPADWTQMVRVRVETRG